MAITYDQVFGALNKRDKEIAQLIMPREGFSSTVYSDVDRQGTETGLAAGFGHRLTDEELKKYKVGDEIPHKQAVDWLRADIARTNEASWKQAYEVPNATEQLQDALHKVNFQLGPGWTQKFPTAWEHMKAGRWDQAIEEIKFTKEGSGQESKWMKQTPERAKDFITALQAQHEASFEKVPSMPEYTEQMGIWDEPPKAEPKDSSNMPNEISTNSQGFSWEEEPSEQKQDRRNMTDNYNEKEDLSNFWTKATRTPQKVEEAINHIMKKSSDNLKIIKDKPSVLQTYQKLYLGYLKDSFKAHGKAVKDTLLLGVQPLASMTEQPSYKQRVDKARQFKPTEKDFTSSELNRLSTFVQEHFNEAHPGKTKNEYSIDLGDPKYEKFLKDKDFYNIAKAFGKINFTIDRKAGLVKFRDSYDFKTPPPFKLPPLGNNFSSELISRVAREAVGPSTGKEYQIQAPLNTNMKPLK